MEGMEALLNASAGGHVTIYARHADYVELMPTWGYAASAFVLFLIGFFGFFLNLMVIILMFKDKQLWTPLNLILFNLVCSDFSVSVLGNPFTLISALAHRWVFGKTMCIVYGFFMTLLGITSITTLTVLSFERYLMVSRPLVSRHLSMRGASCSVFCIWLYSLLVTTPPLFGWGGYVNEAANISCSINWEEQTLNALTYIVFLFVTGLILPMFIITFSYLNIIRTMKKNTLRMGRVTRAESRVTMMVLIMIVTFLVAWSPYSVLALMEQFAPHDMVSPAVGVIPALVAKSSICYDPVIYVGMNTQFRASVKRIFGFGEREDSLQGERGLENTLVSPSKAISQFPENLKLEYINPNNNTLTTVTIYQDQEPYSATKLPDCRRSKKAPTKKKNFLMDSAESSEISRDIYLKDLDITTLPCKSSNENITPESTTENIANRETAQLNKTDKKPFPLVDNAKSMWVEMEDMRGAITSQRDSGERVDLDSKHVQDNVNISGSEEADCGELLLARDLDREIGIDNVSAMLEESETRKKFCASAMSYRRRSMATTRRKSGGGVSGHTRKMSAVMFDRHTTITRLMVDERERSKFMCFDKLQPQHNSSSDIV